MKHRKKKKKKKKVKLESFIPVLDQHRLVKEGYRSIFPRTIYPVVVHHQNFIISFALIF